MAIVIQEMYGRPFARDTETGIVASADARGGWTIHLPESLADTLPHSHFYNAKDCDYMRDGGGCFCDGSSFGHPTGEDLADTVRSFIER